MILIILPLVGLFLALLLLLLLLLIIDRLVVLHLFGVAKEVADLFFALLMVQCPYPSPLSSWSIIYIILLFGQVVVLLEMAFTDVLLILWVFSLDLYFFVLFNIIRVLAVLLLVKVLVLGLSLHLLINFHPIGAVVLLGKPVLHVSEVLLWFR